jgi:hypothetical protein|nr:MAG TPA: HeH/LEM domain [Caudoviricetes sp.]
MMILMNKTARVIFAGEYRLVPEVPQEVNEDKTAFLKMYPRIKSLIDKGDIQIISEEEAQAAKQALEDMTVTHLREYAAQKGIAIPDGLKKADILELIKTAEADE